VRAALGERVARGAAAALASVAETTSESVPGVSPLRAATRRVSGSSVPRERRRAVLLLGDSPWRSLAGAIWSSLERGTGEVPPYARGASADVSHAFRIDGRVV